MEPLRRTDANSDVERLLDVRGVADRLAVSTKAVRALILRGELPAYKIAGRIRIDPQELDAYLLRARVPTENAPAAPAPPAPPGKVGSLRALMDLVPGGRRPANA